MLRLFYKSLNLFYTLFAVIWADWHGCNVSIVILYEKSTFLVNDRRHCDISFSRYRILLNIYRCHIGMEISYQCFDLWNWKTQTDLLLYVIYWGWPLSSGSFDLDPAIYLFDFTWHQNFYLASNSVKFYLYKISLSPQMNALGSSSKWPSYDSLQSTSSFLLSESEQTEDEADVFSEGEGDSGITKSLPVSGRITLSRNYFGFAAHSGQPHSRSKCDQPDHCPAEAKHPGSASSPGAATLGSSSATPGDLVFAQKVSTLKLIPRSLFQYFCQPNIRSAHH